MENHARIEVAGPRAHHEAARRRETHRGVERLSVCHGGHARAVAQVRDYQARWHVARQSPQDVLVRDAVKAVAPHARVEQFAWDWETLSSLGHAAMKFGVEAYNLRQLRMPPRN